MKLSEFKAQYLPWSKEYKLREHKEREEHEARVTAYWKMQREARIDQSNALAQIQLAKLHAQQNAKNYYAPPEPLVKQAPPTIQSTGSDFLTGMVAGAVLDSVFNHPNSGTLGSDSSSSYSSSDSDSSSSWSDSGSSSWD